MGCKSRRKTKKRRNRGGERLQEWNILKEFNIVPSSRTVCAEECASASAGAENTECEPVLPDLLVEQSRPTVQEHAGDKQEDIQGRRIVDIAYFVDQLFKLSHGSQFGCSLSNLLLKSEIKRGLRSGFIFVCKMCGFKKTIWSEPQQDGFLDVNTAAVAGAVSAGGGFANLTKITGAMNIRCMSYNTYDKCNRIISKGWEDSAVSEMKFAAEQEAVLARERGDVDRDGVPLLTVVADGCWSKRSYRTNYNSLSGVVAIVGYHTKKVLYFGVKNKYCVVCARASNKELQGSERVAVPKHTCFKNWNGSSSSMESMAIVEGFLLSEEMHGVRYSKIIADGDSSVYTKILEYRPYDGITVEKVECRNHLLRNYCNKLKEITITSCKAGGESAHIDRGLHIKLRRILGARIVRCRTAVTKAIEHRKAQDVPFQTKVENLRKDIINGPSHVFGEHEICQDIGYFCDGSAKEGEKNYVPEMKNCGIYQKIMGAVNCLADYSSHLIQDVDSNIAEHYNSSVAMLTGGKRTNLIQRNSYRTRCAAAVVQHNTGRPFYSLHKSIAKSSPGNFSKLYETRTKRKAEEEFQRRKKKPKSKRSLVFSTSGPDKDYGPHAQKPDLDRTTFEVKLNAHLQLIKKTEEEISALERMTVNQRDSKEWIEERRLRVTASNFGLICNRRAESSCGPVVSQLLYANVDSAATRYGQVHEEDAIKQFENITGATVTRCGLFVDKDQPWLAASPDGLVGDDAILEVKCPLAAKDMTPDQLIKNKKGVVGSFWQLDKANNSLVVKKGHNYYHQVQGQLHITKRQYCFFVVWTPLGIKVEKIKKDDIFWSKVMFPKLEQFYFNCLIPELIDPRRRRNMAIKEPEYILDAQRKKSEKNEPGKTRSR